jgi:alkylation response protein AidB-like acyl-CoA dehydrogenase
MVNSANLSRLVWLPMLTAGACLIEAHASEELKEKSIYRTCMAARVNSMCLTEPHAGTDNWASSDKAANRRQFKVSN